MATKILTSISAVMFSYELQMVEISTSEAAVAVTFASGDEVLLQETYVPGRSGTVTLYDLNAVADAFIGNAPMADFSITAGDASATFRVLRSSVAYDTTAAAFLPAHFLTSADAVRFTSHGRYECLNFYATAAAPVTAECVFWNDETGGVEFKSVTVRAADYAVGSVVTVDVSPNKFGIEDRTLMEYTVRCGERSQRYRVEAAVAADPAIAFRNRFNVWDTYYFTGTKESDPQFERSQSWINGQYLTYKVQEVMQYKAMTAPVPVGLEGYIEDIARSPEIRLLDRHGAMRDLLTVVDEDVKAANDDSALNVFSVTYRHADRVSAKSFLYPQARIFDDSFDESYE